MTMPNFLIIGAAKSGTTALYHYLKQHPQIYMSPTKETEFFAFEGETLDFQGPGDRGRASITNFEAYQAQFQAVTTETAIGEAATVCLYSEKAADRIFYYLPNAKLIAILRDPIERAYSQFLMFVRDEREPILDFAKALQEEENRIRDYWAWGWRYVQLGFYSVQLQRYYERFDRNQIKVYLYEDLSNSPIQVIQDIFTFLGVDATFVPNMSTKPNISGMPKNQVWHSFLRKPHVIKETFKPLVPVQLRKKITMTLRNQNLVKPQLSPQIRQQLLPVFREDILRLQELIGRDLSPWLE